MPLWYMALELSPEEVESETYLKSSKPVALATSKRLYTQHHSASETWRVLQKGVKEQNLRNKNVMSPGRPGSLA